MKKKLILGGFLILSLCFITTGLFLYNYFKDNLSGIYIRKIYGSVSNLENNSLIFNYEVYNFDNQNMDFLKEVDYLRLNDENTMIYSIQFSLENKVNDLVIYDLKIILDFKKYGEINIKQLIYEKDEQYLEFELGDIKILNLEKKRLSLNHGVDSNFYNNTAYVTFSASNLYAFRIEELIYANAYIKNLKYEDNQKYVPQDTLDFVYEIENSVNEYDVFVFLPVFKLSMESTGETSYFNPRNWTMEKKELTYVQIKEYVK